MDGEVATELIYDQGLYYPPVNYYPYFCTGMTPPNEWDDQHKFLNSNGQDIQFSGLQTESLHCVYYTPSYEYAPSPYNPFNPYIPGAVIGTDNQFIGTQQNFSGSSYLQTVSAPGYVPFVCQPASETLLNGSPDQLLFSSNAPKYAPSLPSLSAAASPLKLSLDNLSLERSQSSSHQMQASGRLSEGLNAVPRKQFSSYGALVNGSAPQMYQRMEHMPRGGSPSVHSSVKVNLPANNVTSLRANVPEWVPGDRMRPLNEYSGFSSRSLVESNRPPRTNKPRVQLTSSISLSAYTTKAGTANLDGNIIVNADQYNRDDFPVDYQDAKFFVIKSYSEDDVHKSIKYNVWSSTSSGNRKLNVAYEEAMRLSVGKPRKCPVFLFFSVNASGHFCGVAEMCGPVDFHKDMDFWLQDKWPGSFPVKWHIIKDVPNSSFRHIILVNNEYRPVTSSRDTQEIPYLPGINMLTIFKNSPLKTSVLDDFMHYEERQRAMQEEKSLLVSRVYEPAVPSQTIGMSAKPGDVIIQPSKTDDSKPSRTDARPITGSANETNTKPTNLDSDGDARISINRSVVDQDPSSAGTQGTPQLNSLAKETNTKPNNLESNRRTPTNHTVVEQDPGSAGKQRTPQLNSLAKETNTKPNNLELNGRTPTNHTVVEQDPGSAGKQQTPQLNSLAKETNTKPNNLESNGRTPTNHTVVEQDPGSAGKQRTPQLNSLTKSYQLESDGGKQVKYNNGKQLPEAVPNQAKHPKVPPKGSVRSSSTDVLTVGSMEIKLTNAKNSLSAPLTSGPIRMDRKG